MVSLEKHVQQLRNVIAKHTGSSMPQVSFTMCLFSRLFVELTLNLCAGEAKASER